MDLDAQAQRVTSALSGLGPSDRRLLIAIGGPPASGKSTLAERVQQQLIQSGTPCGLVPMDGFHLDNDTLRARGLLARKGAPETFDVSGFHALLDRLRHEDDVSIPLFDRAHDCVRANAAQITRAQRHVVVEGNYLFLDTPPWRDLHALWSYSVFLGPPIDVLKARLVQRWLDHGLTPAAAQARATGNDLVNAQTVLTQSALGAVDLVL